ncbi:MAG TPA: efflux RND transporter periplasmic adaptor subunit [Dokdonella sp.]
MKISWLFAALLCTPLCLAAAETKQSPAREHADESPLVLDAAAQKRLGIVTAVVEQHALEHEIRAPGEVKSNAYASALVSPRIPAQVVRRHARLGDQVKAGQALVSLSSVEVAEAQGVLIVSEREWQRVQSLGAEAVSAKRHTEAQVARDQARARLRAYGIGDGEIAALLKQGSARATGEFTLTAPQSGRVSADDFVIGERIEPGKPLFALNDESTVWVEAQLAPDAVERVRAGAAARVQAHGQSLPGKVVQLSHRTVEGSRTTPVRIEVANPGDLLHAGEFVEAYIASAGATTSLAIPSAAITQLQGQASVFKASAAGGFDIAPIAVGETRGGLTVVAQGLAAGEVIVVDGVYALKARLLKSQLGEGHAD